MQDMSITATVAFSTAPSSVPAAGMHPELGRAPGVRFTHLKHASCNNGKEGEALMHFTSGGYRH